MKEFGTLYVFELKKILGQRLVLVSLLLGVAMIFGWNLLTFSSTGYYYNVYNAQDGTVERQIANYGAVEAHGPGLPARIVRAAVGRCAHGAAGGGIRRQ